MIDEAAKQSEQFEKFVFRRLEEPFPFFGQQLPENMWLVALAVVMVPALVYVILMYAKDARGVGSIWASVLGTLRLAVYAILGIVFLLPAQQTFVRSESESKVIIVYDVSGSMQTSDDPSTGAAGEQRTTRQDLVLQLMRDEKVDFLNRLVANNPVTAYRMGAKLADEYVLFTKEGALTRLEREKPEVVDDRQVAPKPTPLSRAFWSGWLVPEAKIPEALGVDEGDQKRLTQLAIDNANLVKARLHKGTNLGDSLMAILNKELNNRVQGVVVFTDGRNNEGSTAAFRELEQRVKTAKVPLFVVGVGEDRVKIRQEVLELLAPPVIQPEDRFRARAQLAGEGLAGQPADVSLEITHVRTYKAKEKGKDGKIIEVEKEELLPIELVERENPENPKSVRARENLGTKLTIKPFTMVNGKKEPTPILYDKSAPTPLASVEWQLDAAAFAAAAGKTLDASKKWEIGETKDDADLRFVVKLAVDKREGLGPKKFHQSIKTPLKVVKKPLRILLMAAGANRDFQFVQVLLSREVTKKRMEMTVYLQRPPGVLEARTGVVQNVPPDRLLHNFPNSFKEKKDLFDLQSYDVIVAYDPDWRQLSTQQIKLIKNWADAGGGLILVGGYINTVELIRPQEGGDADRYKPILDLLPVVLDDRRDYIERKADDPWALNMDDATPEMEFLKLDETLDETKFREDWKDFFYGEGKERTEKAIRGFYGFYPVEKAKVGSLVAARFTDPATKLKDGTLHPYLVATPEALPRAVWIGSAETWRLREYKEAFHERFWTKLVRYAAAKSKGTTAKAIRLEVGREFPALRYVDVAAKIDGPGGEPLPPGAKPQITLKMPPGANEKEINRGEPIIMSARPGAKDGWYSGRFQVRTPGEYELTVTVLRKNVPGLDSDLSEPAKFTVKESNPELDNTRPDYDLMYRLASDADDVMRRMKPAEAAELRKNLVRPKLGAADAADGEKGKPEISLDKPRLYFNLKNASLIPTCMVEDKQVATSKGPHHDWWDEGPTLWTPTKVKEGDPEPQPIKLPLVLIIVVGLLSAEWLTRKLLRLA